MLYISIEEAVYLHEQIIKKSGGSLGIRDFGLLHASLERPKASFGGADLYPNIYLKSAALFHSLILNHPFVDGNKRTALSVLFLFLERNGLFIKARKKELIDLCLKVEKKQYLIKNIAEWLRKYSKNA